MAARRPRFDEVLDGVRVRVFASRSEFEVLFGDDEITDADAYVLCYPKLGTPATWAHQGRAEYREPTAEPAATDKRTP